MLSAGPTLNTMMTGVSFTRGTTQMCSRERTNGAITAANFYILNVFVFICTKLQMSFRGTNCKKTVQYTKAACSEEWMLT